MAKPSGQHSSHRKGDNGRVAPKAPGQTTQTDGPLTGSNGAGGDASSMNIVARGSKP